ncbi:hypothetical protein QWZ08_20115 [Ferruginibacter paludis]|uniref:hypothetical protein n=1 Tax=Ferruginibacter paludis TaxID=1310417 RepID=UPI0025B42F51|nr:hypothetical protein [Ferruginibacter paludis]MDN3657968.1 hypothetical protein [Ferruginibacter paludis]
MKKFIITPATLLIGTMLFLTACSKYSPTDTSTSTTVTPATLTTALTSGTWILSSFVQRTEDKTSKFADYVFVFAANGTVTATSKGVETQGTWSYTPAVTYYGSTSKSAIALNLGTSAPLDLLTKTWNFVSVNSTTLKVDSPELAEGEHVQFSKK